MTENIIVIDGNVTIESGAIINGRVIVIGGDIIIRQGAKLEERPWIIAPQGHPVVSLVVGIFLLLGASSLIILPVVFWLIGHLFKKAAWYPIIKGKLLAVQRRWPTLYIAASFGISALILTVFATLAWETLFRNVMISITDVGFGVSYLVIVAISFLLLIFMHVAGEK